jgi:hypothetical protein
VYTVSRTVEDVKNSELPAPFESKEALKGRISIVL